MTPSPSKAKSSTAPNRPPGEAAQSSLPASHAPARRAASRSAAPPDRTEQRRDALRRANDIRLARAKLKAKIASGEIFAASVLLDPPAAARSWELADLLACQWRWKETRARKFCRAHLIPEIKPIGALTERQRRELARALGQGSEGEGSQGVSGGRPGGSSGDLASGSMGLGGEL